jgi:U3 small nucleolar RNA-associated protein 14
LYHHGPCITLIKSNLFFSFFADPPFYVMKGSHGARGGSSGGELTVGDLMMGLPSSDRKKLTPASRKILEKLSHEPSPAEIPSSAASKASRKRKAAGDDKEGKSKDAAGTKRPKPLSSASKGGLVTAPIAAPLPRVIKERQERKAGYEDTKEEVTKWQSIVKANREAPTVVFTTAKGDVARVNSTRAIVANHTPQSEMEAEVAALLEAAGAASSKVRKVWAA